MDNHLKQVTSKEQDSIFQPIVEAISRTMNLPVSVWVFDEQSQTLRIKAAVGLPIRYVRKAFLSLSEPSVTGECFTSGKVVIVHNVLSDPRWKYRKEAKAAGWKSVLCVPIQAHSVIIGVINIYTFVIRDFTDLEKQLLADYANQIGLALEAGRRLKAIGRLLDIGDEFARLITKQPQVVLQEIVRGACEVTGADCAVIYPYDAVRGDFYDIESVAHHGLNNPLELKDKPRKTGLGAYVVSQGKLVRSDIDKEDQDMLKSPFIAREGVKAFMGIALEIAHRVLGILYVDFRTPHPFSNEEKDIIRLFAHQAAIAIDNSRLYQQANTRAEALKRLHKVGPTLVSTSGAPTGLGAILAQIVNNAQDVLGADLVDLYQYIQSKNEYVLPSIQAGIRYDTSVRKDRIYADDVVCTIVKSRRPRCFAETQQEPTLTQPYTVVRPDSPPKRFVLREGIQSTAAVPLIVGTEVVGVLFANYRSLQTFPQQQQELVELFANQAAIAIRNARLFEQRRELQSIARDITRILDKDELLQKILSRSIGLLGCEIGSIALLNKTTNQLEFQYAIRKKGYFGVPFGKGLIGTAAETREPVRVGNVTKDTRYIKHVAATRSELDVPMLIGNELIGVLNAESTRYNAFDGDSEELAVTLASQAAVALYNAALFEQRSALVDFGRAVTSGIRLREDEVLELIHRQASKLMDTDNMYVALYDEATDTVRFGLAFVDGKRIDVTTEIPWQPRKAGRGRTEEIIRTKKPILTATKAQAEAWYAQPEHSVAKEYTGGVVWASWLGVPMMVGEKVLGVIAAYHPTLDNVYSDDNLEILQAMANQAAIALDNSYMFYDVNRRLEALVEFGQTVTSDICLREDEVLGLIHNQASKLMDTNNMYIALYDESANTVRFPLAFVDGKHIDIVSRKAGKGLTEEIIRAKNQLLIVTKEEVEAWYAQPGHKEYVGVIPASWVGVPMMVGEKVLGVIATYHPTRDYVYSGDDLAILQGMANQAAIAIENAALLEEKDQALRALREEQGKSIAAGRLAAVNIVAAGFVHRMGNVAGTIPVRVEQIKELLDPVDPKHPRFTHFLEAISEDVEGILKAARAIQTSTTTEPLELVNIDTLVSTAVQRIAAPSNISVCSKYDPGLPPVLVFSGQFVDALENIIRNGIEAIEGVGSVTITCKTLMTENQDRIAIEDTGRGIPPENLPKIFDLFFSTKGGMGFALWRTKTLVESLGGKITVASEVDKGTVFTILLPVAKEVK